MSLARGVWVGAQVDPLVVFNANLGGANLEHTTMPDGTVKP